MHKTVVSAVSRCVRSPLSPPHSQCFCVSVNGDVTWDLKQDVFAQRADPILHPQPASKAQPFRYYAVMDLEATCDERSGFMPQEIIELPVVLLDSTTGQVVDEFRTFVRPQVHPSLTEFCTQLTGLEGCPALPSPVRPIHATHAEPTGVVLEV